MDKAAARFRPLDTPAKPAPPAAFHGITCSISSRNLSRRVTFS